MTSNSKEPSISSSALGLQVHTTVPDCWMAAGNLNSGAPVCEEVPCPLWQAAYSYQVIGSGSWQSESNYQVIGVALLGDVTRLEEVCCCGSRL